MEGRCVSSLAEAKALEERFLKSKASKYTDTSFPASTSSIGHRERSLSHGVKWARLGEVLEKPALFVDGVESGDVIQGELGDCWLLGAMSVVATRSDLMFPLFISAHIEQGFYQVRFFLDGQWRYVTIDDYIPFKQPEHRVFKFAHCKDPNEMWVPLLEKAFAKLMGCYEHVQSGNFSEGMTNLTGEGCETLTLTRAMVKDGTLWTKLQYYEAEAFLMGCSIAGSGERDNGRGLLIGHAYAVLAVANVSGKHLIKLRNPWGMKEWKGAFSDNSREMTPALMAQLKHTNADDGTFWMSFEDWSSNFDSFAVCRLLTDEIGKVWEKRVFTSSFNGGCCNHRSWTKNEQFWLTVTGNPVECFVHLAQQDSRSRGSPQCRASIGCYLFRTTGSEGNVKKVERTQDDCVHTPTFVNSREYSFSIRLSVGTYLLLPCTFAASDNERFFLSVYSEDPVQCGQVGRGPAPRAAVEQHPPIKSLAWLNRPGAPPPPIPRRPHAPHIVSAPPPVPSRSAPPQSPPSRSLAVPEHQNRGGTTSPRSPTTTSTTSSVSPRGPSTTKTTTTTTTTSPDGTKTTRTTTTTLTSPSHSESSRKPAHSPSSGSGSVMCKRCLRSIKSGESYVTRNGRTYCQKHAYEKCKGCKKDLTGGTVMTFQGKKFHPGCLKCSSCRAALGSQFYKKGGKIVCAKCAR